MEPPNNVVETLRNNLKVYEQMLSAAKAAAAQASSLEGLIRATKEAIALVDPEHTQCIDDQYAGLLPLEVILKYLRKRPSGEWAKLRDIAGEAAKGGGLQGIEHSFRALTITASNNAKEGRLKYRKGKRGGSGEVALPD